MVCHDPPWLPSCSNTHFTWYSIILTPCPCRRTAAPPVRYHCTGLLPAIGVEKVATTNGPWGWWTCAQNHRVARWIESSCLSCTWNISKCASLRSPVYTRYSIDLYHSLSLSCDILCISAVSLFASCYATHSSPVLFIKSNPSAWLWSKSWPWRKRSGQKCSGRSDKAIGATASSQQFI